MDSEDFGRRLRVLMADRAMNVSQLASMVGISRQMVYSYLNNGAIPNLDTAVKIARALGVSVDDLSLTPLGNVLQQ